MEDQLAKLTASAEELTMYANALWVLVSAALVFFMHAGFALVESGFCRRKNAVMVLMKNFGVVAVSSIIFFLVGYGVMFGEGNAFMGLASFFPNNGGADSDLPPYVFLFFQLVFAATACTIVSGAIAERARLLTFFIFTAIATMMIYPVVGHWVWGGGWLSEAGFMDFAGSTVVHGVGGGMALAGALIIGPRLGRYLKDGTSRPMPAHNFPLAALGVLILWLGWFGFNGGSELAIDAEVGRIVLVTNIAASAGFLGALAWIRMRSGLLDLSMALNGALAGLVGITAGCYNIPGGWAIVVGLLAGVLCVEGVLLLDKLRIDDPVGAITVHGICGIFGTIAVGLFGYGNAAELAEPVGLFVGGGASQLWIQTYGALAGVGFAFLIGGLVWLMLKFLVPGGVRVSEAHELEGLDIAECGVEAYNEELAGVHADIPMGASAREAAGVMVPAENR
ncbi:MAG: ammonium transporter [Myxococcales bacterium]|nr:ammonium transporter [Myxococcales bacterium]MDH3482639.1 ammonium transporter [Myxococcales bacterium]